MAEKKPEPKKQEAKKKTKSFKAYKPGRSCPKCGPGVRLAQHSSRLACGKCGYSETVSKAA